MKMKLNNVKFIDGFYVDYLTFFCNKKEFHNSMRAPFEQAGFEIIGQTFKISKVDRKMNFTNQKLSKRPQVYFTTTYRENHATPLEHITLKSSAMDFINDQRLCGLVIEKSTSLGRIDLKRFLKIGSDWSDKQIITNLIMFQKDQTRVENLKKVSVIRPVQVMPDNYDECVRTNSISIGVGRRESTRYTRICFKNKNGKRSLYLELVFGKGLARAIFSLLSKTSEKPVEQKLNGLINCEIKKLVFNESLIDIQTNKKLEYSFFNKLVYNKVNFDLSILMLALFLHFGKDEDENDQLKNTMVISMSELLFTMNLPASSRGREKLKKMVTRLSETSSYIVVDKQSEYCIISKVINNFWTTRTGGSSVDFHFSLNRNFFYRFYGPKTSKNMDVRFIKRLYGSSKVTRSRTEILAKILCNLNCKKFRSLLNIKTKSRFLSTRGFINTILEECVYCDLISGYKLEMTYSSFTIYFEGN